MNDTDQPALFIATQTTIPTLTGIASALCLGAIALAANESWPSMAIPWVGMASKCLAIPPLSIAAFAFLLSTHCCVNSHAWDIHAIGDARRKDWKIGATSNYTNRCVRRCKLWHVLAASSYNFGTIFLLVGLFALFLKASPFVSTLAVVFLLVSLASALATFRPSLAEKREEIIERLESRLIK